jgi:hypothetical protein
MARTKLPKLHERELKKLRKKFDDGLRPWLARTRISIPVGSQLLGCTPLGPVGWGGHWGNHSQAMIACNAQSG